MDGVSTSPGYRRLSQKPNNSFVRFEYNHVAKNLPHHDAALALTVFLGFAAFLGLMAFIGEISMFSRRASGRVTV